MNEALYDILLARLVEDASMQGQAGSLVLAACEGKERLAERLQSGEAPVAERRGPGARPQPARAYLKAIHVRGFRGIGPQAKLELTAGPGLTLVVGRNGSGKSSFAEGLEVLLTGDNQRWSERSSVWKESWQNLHVDGERMVGAELLVEGAPGVTRVWRAWPKHSTRTDQGLPFAQVHGQPRTGLESLGWQEAVVTFRPFLSYHELGTMLDRPSAVYDALSAVLGLGDLVEARELVRQARLESEREEKGVKAELTPLLGRLRSLTDDPRSRRCAQALSARTWDLETVERVLAGGEAEERAGGDAARLQRWSALEAPSAKEVASAALRLREAAAGARAVQGTDAARWLRAAELLQAALALHADRGDADCPVCGRERALNEEWRTGAEREAGELRSRATRAEQARGAVCWGPLPPSKGPVRWGSTARRSRGPGRAGSTPLQTRTSWPTTSSETTRSSSSGFRPSATERPRSFNGGRAAGGRWPSNWPAGWEEPGPSRGTARPCSS